MSTPTPSRPPAPVSPTRQQLDELEALMQRMLALPVHPLEAESVPAPPPRTVETPTVSAPVVLVTQPRPQVLAETEVPEKLPEPGTELPASVRLDAPMVEPRRPSWLEPLPSVPVAETSLVPRENTGLTWGDESPAESAVDIRPLPRPSGLDHFPSVPALPEARSEGATEDPAPLVDLPSTYHRWRQPPVAGWLQPLVTFNTAFDRSVSWLGPLGRWLQGPRGRAALGWIGLVFLSAALALTALDWMGWTR